MREITKHYKEYTITLQKDSRVSDWYIIVFSDEGYSYDGWWKNSADKTENEAFKEALIGACIDDGIKEITNNSW